ncbi:ABC transporter permease [Hanstruepera ponticola]|uniref:ABC transporter permease n=1 Tax=Hanstruepera ponticola TaxID=2042995 RepID=UPI000CF0CBB7|nr:ABC transporter permease [Hanstruepera ponticola]
MNFSLYIAKRYLLSKSSNNAINFITIIAAISVIIGALSLFIVLSGFAGLKDFTLQFTSIIDPDLKAEPYQGKSFYISDSELKDLENIPDVVSFAKIVEERVFISFEGRNHNAFIKGVDSNYTNIHAVDSIVPLGSWFSEKTNQVVTGWGIANRLSIGVLDYGKAVNLYVPKPGKGQISSIEQAFNSVRAVNVGIFDVNEALNEKYIYVPIEMAQHLTNYEANQISALEFKLRDGFDEEEIRTSIQKVLGDKIILKNKSQLNDALHKMLNTENLAVYLIFTLILIIALFNVIGSIIMMILDKKKTLHTLYNLGATLKDIRRIFFLQGSLMTLFGGLIGLILGLILVWLQETFGLVMLTASLPYPMSIKIENILLVYVTISILGIGAAKIASSRITRNLVSN